MGNKLRSSGLGRDLAMDLGTSTVLAAARGKGILLREPAVAAVDRQTGQVLQVGQAAQDMLGRTPGQLLAVRPLAGGVVADFTVAQAMLQAFLKKALPGHLGKPRLLLAVPSSISEVEERALVEAALQAGARKVCLVEAPLAAALGAGLDPASPQGAMVVDLGGGTTDSGVIALGGVAAAGSIPLGGDGLDRALLQFVRRTHGVLLGQRTAEEVKRTIGRVGDGPEGPALTVKGRCLTTGLPREVTLTAAETAQAFAPAAAEMAAAVQEVLERTPPELSADVAQAGILLTGGGSLLRGLDKAIAEATGVPVTVAEDPEACTVLGLEQLLPTIHKLPHGPQNFARKRQFSGR